MNVSWYYSVKGTRKGPVTWEGIRAAVESGDLTPQDFVWSPSFGTDWRPASSLTGLFPSLEPEPSAQTASPETVAPPALELPFEIPKIKSPFSPPESVAAGVPLKPERVRCLKSLGRAWHNTIILLFSTFSLRRWIVFAVCLMLTMIAPPGPLTGFSAASRSENANPQIAKLGLQDVVSTGIFTVPQKIVERQTKERLAFSNASFLKLVGDAMRETAVATSAWLKSGKHFSHLAIAFLTTLFMYAVGIWFTARGHVMFFSRIYRPDDVIFATWVESDKPSATLFHGMLCIRLITVAASIGLGAWAINSLVAIPTTTEVPARLVARILIYTLSLMLADKIAMGYVRDFVTPHIVLEGKQFLKSLGDAGRLLGFWYVRYALTIFVAYAILALGMSFIGLLFGMNGQLAVTVIFLSPVLGSLLTLPLHLLRRLWSLDIVFRLKPELRMAVPVIKIMRIMK